MGIGGRNRPIKLIVTNRQLAILASQQWVVDSAEFCRLRQLVNKNTWSRVRCIRSMYRSFWPLILEQAAILPAMSNYFLSYTQIIGPWLMTDAKRKPYWMVNIMSRNIFQYLYFYFSGHCQTLILKISIDELNQN